MYHIDACLERDRERDWRMRKSMKEPPSEG